MPMSKVFSAWARFAWAVCLALVSIGPPKGVLCAQVAYIGDGAASRPGQPAATSLLAALNDSSVTEIVVLGVESVADVQAEPVQLNRSVMIRGGSGAAESVINFNFLRNKVVFTGGAQPIRVTFRDLTMNNSRWVDQASTEE